MGGESERLASAQNHESLLAVVFEKRERKLSSRLSGNTSFQL